MPAQSSGGGRNANNEAALKAVSGKQGKILHRLSEVFSYSIPRIYAASKVGLFAPCRPATVPSLILKLLIMENFKLPTVLLQYFHKQVQAHKDGVLDPPVSAEIFDSVPDEVCGVKLNKDYFLKTWQWTLFHSTEKMITVFATEKGFYLDEIALRGSETLKSNRILLNSEVKYMKGF